MEVLKSGYKAASAAACAVRALSARDFFCRFLELTGGFSWPRRRRYRRALQARVNTCSRFAACGLCRPGFSCTRRSTPKLGCISLCETKNDTSLHLGVPRGFPFRSVVSSAWALPFSSSWSLSALWALCTSHSSYQYLYLCRQLHRYYTDFNFPPVRQIAQAALLLSKILVPRTCVLLPS